VVVSETIEVSKLIADEIDKIRQDHSIARKVTEYIEETSLFVRRISDSVSTAKKIFLLEKYFPFQVDRIVYMFTSAIRFLESIDKKFLEIVLDEIDKIPIGGTPHEEVLRKYLYAALGSPRSLLLRFSIIYRANMSQPNTMFRKTGRSHRSRRNSSSHTYSWEN